MPQHLSLFFAGHVLCSADKYFSISISIQFNLNTTVLSTINTTVLFTTTIAHQNESPKHNFLISFSHTLAHTYTVTT